MIYLAMFAVTAFLLFVGGKCRGLLNWILVAAALALPCLLAGVRDETVGLDVLSYAKWMCIDAQNMDFLQFMVAEHSLASVGWNLFTWVIVKLTGDLPGYLFFIEVLCIVPVYAGLRRTVRDYEWLGMLMWLLLEYSFTLNGMRQSAAMGFVLLASSYLLEHRDGRYALWCLVGLLFHQTAVIGLLFWPLARWMAIGSGFKRLFGRFSGVAIAMIVIMCGTAALALGPRVVIALSVFKESYQYQVNHLGENDFSLAGAYLFMTVLLIWRVARQDFADGKTDGKGTVLGEKFGSICLIAAVGCLAWQLNLVSATLGRVGDYGAALIPYAGGGTRGQWKQIVRAQRGAAMHTDRLFRSYGVGAGQERHVAVHVYDFGDWIAWASWPSTRRAFGGARSGMRCILALAGGR